MKGFTFLVGAVLFWGFSNFFLKIARNRIDTVSTLFYDGLGFFLAMLIVVYFRSGFAISFDKIGAGWALLAAVTLTAGGYFFLEALGMMKLAIAMPFSALNVLVSAILGIIILGERLTLFQIVGAISMIVGAILLSTPGSGGE